MTALADTQAKARRIRLGRLVLALAMLDDAYGQFLTGPDVDRGEAFALEPSLARLSHVNAQLQGMAEDA